MTTSVRHPRAAHIMTTTLSNHGDCRRQKQMAHSLLLLLFIAAGCSVCLVQCVPAPGPRSRENLHMAKLLRDLNLGHDDRQQLFDDVRSSNSFEMLPYVGNRAPLQMSRRQSEESPELSIGVAVALLRDLVRLREESLVREAAIEANEDHLKEIGKRRCIRLTRSCPAVTMVTTFIVSAETKDDVSAPH
ncbi:hypothetical protein Bbelb_248830 [Branchiostoma belcheri]|nr:hypothetical protein Bbelb_248830 [Branchiostoma belcheri]